MSECADCHKPIRDRVDEPDRVDLLVRDWNGEVNLGHAPDTWEALGRPTARAATSIGYIVFTPPATNERTWMFKSGLELRWPVSALPPPAGSTLTFKIRRHTR